MGEADMPAKPHTRRNIPEEHHRPRQVRPRLSQPEFNWKALDIYVELFNFEMEVADCFKQKYMISLMKRRCPL